MEVNCRNCVHCKVRLKLAPPNKLIPRSLNKPNIHKWFKQRVDYDKSPVRCTQDHWTDSNGNEQQLKSYMRVRRENIKCLEQARDCPGRLLWSEVEISDQGLNVYIKRP